MDSEQHWQLESHYRNAFNILSKNNFRSIILDHRAIKCEGCTYNGYRYGYIGMNVDIDNIDM